MAAFKPIIISAGQFQQLQSGDDLSLPNDLIVSGDVSADTASITNAITGGSLTVTGAVSAASVAATGAITGGSLDVTGEVEGNTLNVVTSAVIGTTLSVVGASTLDSLTVTNNASVGGTLDVTGNTTLSGTLTVGGVEIPLEVLESNLDLFISTSGDDVNNDGLTAGAPFATLERAHEEFLKYVIGVGGSITVNIAAGHYTRTAEFAPTYPFGGGVFWVGEQETVGSVSVSNIDASHSTDVNFSAVQYFDCDLDLSGASSVSQGDFVLIDSVSGGTNPETLYGLHRIEALSSGTATIRIWQRASTPEIASGSITVDCHIIKTVFRYSGGDNGISAVNAHAGTWASVVLEGTDSDTYNNANGLNIRTGGIVFADETVDTFGIHGFGNGISAARVATFDGSRVSISKIRFAGIAASTMSEVNIGLSGMINGCITAIDATSKCEVLFRNSIIHSSAATTCVSADNGSFVNVTNTEIMFDDGTATALFADNRATINATGATITGFSTNKDPATNPGTNDGWIIGP